MGSVGVGVTNAKLNMYFEKMPSTKFLQTMDASGDTSKGVLIQGNRSNAIRHLAMGMLAMSTKIRQ